MICEGIITHRWQANTFVNPGGSPNSFVNPTVALHRESLGFVRTYFFRINLPDTLINLPLECVVSTDPRVESQSSIVYNP